MNFLGIYFVLFGILILINPTLIAYIIAFFFIFLGISLLFFSFKIKKMQSHNPQNEKIFSFGKYEFTRKK